MGVTILNGIFPTFSLNVKNGIRDNYGVVVIFDPCIFVGNLFQLNLVVPTFGSLTLILGRDQLEYSQVISDPQCFHLRFTWFYQKSFPNPLDRDWHNIVIVEEALSFIRSPSYMRLEESTRKRGSTFSICCLWRSKGMMWPQFPTNFICIFIVIFISTT